MSENIRDTPPSPPIQAFAGRRVWITGHRGMLGSAMVRSFMNEEANILLASREELDLTDQSAVMRWMDKNQPEFVFHVGAKVGGIFANSTMPADFLRDNLLIQSNVIDAAHRFGVEKLVFVATNCTYPKAAKQPISEDAILTGSLDENIRAYAVGKIAGIELCKAYRKQYGCNFVSVIPPNLYGPGDNYHPLYGHVVAGILRRAHEAKISGQSKLIVWGDGTARRELLYVDDLAQAMKCLMLATTNHDIFNVGCGRDFAISEIVELIKKAVGFKGSVIYDTSKPNGTMRKLLDSSRIQSLGWRPLISEEVGLSNAYEDFLHLLSSPGLNARL